MKRRIGWTAGLASCLVAGGIAGSVPAGAQGFSWTPVIQGALPAIYGIGIAPKVFLDLFARRPILAGTGFQLELFGNTSDPSTLEVTAGHCVTDYHPSGHYWTFPFQVSFRAVANARWHANTTGTFGPHDTFLGDDVAESWVKPLGTVVAFETAPLITGSILLGNYQDLHHGETVVTIGDAGGRYLMGIQNHYSVRYLTYEFSGAATESGDAPNEPKMVYLPDALWFNGYAPAGMSGSPILNAQGQAVAVVVASNQKYDLTLAVPLDPLNARPVG